MTAKSATPTNSPASNAPAADLSALDVSARHGMSVETVSAVCARASDSEEKNRQVENQKEWWVEVLQRDLTPLEETMIRHAADYIWLWVRGCFEGDSDA